MAGFNPNTINLKAGLDTSRVATGVQKIQGHMSGLSRSVNKSQRTFGGLGVAIAGAFGAQQISQLITSSVELAAKAGGVKNAFNSLNDPNLLESLRRATKGTVDDLKLMQLAVKANNFKIPLDQLSTYLKFAQQRARETGESVDYLVDSIITGLGRQSVMILDNLGVSASELREKMKGGATMAEALGDVINESMSQKASPTFVTAADKLDIMKAKIENLKIQIGEKLVTAVDALAGAFDKLTGNSMEFDQETVAKINSLQREVNAIKSVQEQYDYLEMRINDYRMSIQKVIDSHKFGPFGDKRRNEIKMYNNLIKEAESLQMKLTAVPPPPPPPPEVIVSLQSLNNEMKLLQEKQLTGPISDFQKLQREIDALQAKIDRLTGKSFKGAKDEAKKFNESLEFKSGVGFREAITNALNPPKSDLEQRMAGVNEEMRELGQNLPEIDQMWDSTITSMQARWEQFAQSFKDMIDGFITESIYEFANTLGRALGGAEGAFDNFGQKMLHSFGQFLEQMGKMFIAFGVANLALSNALQPQNLANPAVAVQLIAAGAAMAAIGGAITASMSKFAETGTTSNPGVPSQSFNDGYNFQSRIDGYDIVLVTDRNQRLMTRRG